MNDDIAIRVENLSKTFKLPHEKHSSVKSLFVNFYKRKKTYEVQHAVNNVSFEIKKGEFFGIVGRNGSGKSTLLKLMAGIYSPTRGKITINGSLTPFIELGVGFNPELTGRENVYLNGALLGFNRKEMNRMYKDIVEFAELEKFMDQKLKNYSSGMQVRLAFSIAIRSHGAILLIDEVLAVGDAAFQRKCYEYFEKVRGKKTVVLVSHDMNAVKRFCNRALLVSTGEVTIIGDPMQVAELYNKENAGAIKLSDSAKKTGDAVIEKIEILNDKNRGFLDNEDIELRLFIKASKRTDVYLGLQILNETGQIIAGITSQTQSDRPKILLAGQEVIYQFTFPSKQLAGGEYVIEGTIYEPGVDKPIFYGRSMAQFKAIGRRGWGALSLQGKWEKIS